MTKRRIISLFSIISVTFMLIVGCNNNIEEYSDFQYDTSEPYIEASTEPDYLCIDVALIESYILTLTSAEFAGRMPGTPGNDLAVSWLESKLVTFGFEPYDGVSYRVGYIGRTNVFERSEMIITYGDAVDTLVQGVDFFISLNEGSFNIAIDQNSGSYAFMGDEYARARMTDDAIDDFVYFRNRDKFYNTTYRPGADAFFRGVVVQLSDEIYQRLQNGAFDSIEINNTVAHPEMQLYHVVGKIRGNNPSIAVVLSAHFDHLGEGGTTFFPGAFDNASGTAALLHISERLRAISNEQQFEFDIIIAFFNSEEHGDESRRPFGSQSFVEQLQNDYETIFNINIDAIGLSDYESYVIGNVGDLRLRSAIESFAEERGIVLDSSETIMSDNMNFMDVGLPSVNFTSSYFLTTNIAHTTMDTHEVLSIPQILRLSDMIVDFIADMGNSVFGDGETDDDFEIDEEAEALMFIKFEALLDRLRDGEEIIFYEEFYAYFPEEGQFYFSYYEAIEYDERLTYISRFGDYELRLIRGRPDFYRRTFIYFNAETPDAFDLHILPADHARIETMRQTNDITEIADIPGFYIMRNIEYGVIMGFIFTDGENYFRVHGGRVVAEERPIHRSEPYGYASLTSWIRADFPSRNEEELTEFIRDFQFLFHEFAENWLMFLS